MLRGKILLECCRCAFLQSNEKKRSSAGEYINLVEGAKFGHKLLGRALPLTDGERELRRMDEDVLGSFYGNAIDRPGDYQPTNRLRVLTGSHDIANTQPWDAIGMKEIKLGCDLLSLGFILFTVV